MSCENRSLTLDLLAFGFLEGRERERVADHVEVCPDCRSTHADRREEREIVALVLAMEPEPAPIPVPSTVSPALLITVVAAAVLLLVLGPSLLLPRYETPPVRSADDRSREPDGREPVEPLLSADLAARVRELEARVEELMSAPPAKDRPPPVDPRAAIAGYDWDGLAEALLVVNPELVRGRMPSDTQVLVRYAESLRELARVAAAVGLPGDLTAVARDPRTGPLLFGAVIRRAWPDVAPADVAVAEEGAREAMTDYGSEVAAATTPAGTAAAEERLAHALTEEVEKVEARYGESEVEVTPVVPERSAPRDTTLRKDAEVLVAAIRVGVAEDRVVRGTSEFVAERIATLLATDLRVEASLLTAVTGQWVADYRGVLAGEPADVVAALEAGLAGDAGDTDVAASPVRRLRSALLDTQVRAEGRMLRVLSADARSRLRDASRPTFFLITAPASRAQSLGNSTR